MTKPTPKAYGVADVERRLKLELPHWLHVDGHIARTFKTSGWKATMMAANAVGHLAEVAWHHPDLVVSYASLEVRLQSHDAKGISDKDFELAKKIEETLAWNPAREGSALEGAPRETRVVVE